MATISQKNISTLISEFVRRPIQYENYVKHCLKILESYIWLKENQYNYNIDNYEYVSKFIHNYGMNAVSFQILFKSYKEEIVDKISDSKKRTLHSNVYYLNQVDEFVQNIEKMYIDSPTDKKRLIEGSKQNKKFNRLDFSIISLNDEINFEKEYSYSEIYDMIICGQIIILDNYLSNDYLYISSMDEINSSNKVFLPLACCEFLGINSKIIDNFYACKNEKEKTVWGIFYDLFCKYIRFTKIQFSNKSDGIFINLTEDFNITYNHILEVTNNLLRFYHKKKKKVPEIIQRTSNEIKVRVIELKKMFDKNINEKAFASVQHQDAYFFNTDAGSKKILTKIVDVKKI